MDSKDVEEFAADKGPAKEHVRKYGSGTGDAPKQEFLAIYPLPQL